MTGKKQAFSIIFWQLFLIVALAVVIFLFQGARSGLSTLSGGLAYWLPTLLFVWKVFSHTGARAAKQFLIAFGVGEIVKIFLSAMLFVLVVKYLPVITLSVLIGFVGAVISFWIASIILLARQETSQ